MNEKELKEGEKKEGIGNVRKVAIVALIVSIIFGGAIGINNYIASNTTPTEMGYDMAVLEMNLNERMPDVYFPALIKFNDSFLEKYGVEMVGCGYVFEGTEAKGVGYECRVSFEKEKPTREEIEDSLLTRKCLRYKQDSTCFRVRDTAHFEIIAVTTCCLKIQKIGRAEDYKFCTCDAEGEVTDDCVKIYEGENRLCCRPGEKRAFVNSTGFVFNITIPLQEKLEILVGDKR